MLVKDRLFKRRKPSKDAKSIFIFCEGVKRERQYFKYFQEIDSRINIEVFPLKDNMDNSPLGLFEIAVKNTLKSKSNPDPKYEVLKEDEVWLVFDTDTASNPHRHKQVLELRERCTRQGWHTAQSNPCFEVWLYHHFEDKIPELKRIEACAEWKQIIPGGFNSAKHPIYIIEARDRAKKNFKLKNSIPSPASTEMYELATSILRFTKEGIVEARSQFE